MRERHLVRQADGQDGLQQLTVAGLLGLLHIRRVLVQLVLEAARRVLYLKRPILIGGIWLTHCVLLFAIVSSAFITAATSLTRMPPRSRRLISFITTALSIRTAS